MTTTALKQEVTERLDSLPPEDQLKVLELARALTEHKKIGVRGESLLPFTKGFSKEDIEVMRQAVEEDCEKVDLNGW